MVFAGLGWVTYRSPPLAHYLSPYNLAVDLLGQESVMLWLLVMGVNVQRWKDRAQGSGERRAERALQGRQGWVALRPRDEEVNESIWPLLRDFIRTGKNRLSIYGLDSSNVFPVRPW
jgi:hypothetical protein